MYSRFAVIAMIFMQIQILNKSKLGEHNLILKVVESVLICYLNEREDFIAFRDKILKCFKIQIDNFDFSIH